MALRDVPQILPEFELRIQKLKQKINDNEISRDEVMRKIFSALGKLKMDSNGLKIYGDYGSFEIDSEGLEAFFESAINGIRLFPVVRGKEFFVKKGDDIKKIKIGFGLKKTPAEENDLQSTELPLIELPSDQEGSLPGKLEDITIHRIEEFMGWMEDWGDFSKVLYAQIPLMTLFTKHRLDKLGESLPAFCNDFLERCGV